MTYRKWDVLFLTVLLVLAVGASWLNIYKDASNGRSMVGSPSTPTVTAATPPNPAALPDFGAITDVRKKKKAFFAYLAPLITAQNQALMQIRAHILSLQQRDSLTDADQQWLTQQAHDCQVDTRQAFTPAFFQALLSRVDIIPPSLALAQAANESAWGTSRFAVIGNNLFGQWCFTPGCGLVPKSRPAGAHYEVRRFAQVTDAIRAYMDNLNTSPRYAKLRQLRSQQRLQGIPVTGLVLAQGLSAYSTRGQDYINELMAMITANHLASYDG